MSEATNGPNGWPAPRTDSGDCIDVIVEGKGDNTRRPATPEERARLQAWKDRRDRIVEQHKREQEQKQQEEQQDKPRDKS